MLRNYFKVAFRNLLQNKSLSFINIFGLAIGMAFAMLIGLWIQSEMSFNSFHKNVDRIAVVRKNTLFNNERNTQISIPLPLYDELRLNYPEIKHISRADWGNPHSLMTGNEKFKKKGLYVDPDFLKMFSFPLKKGNIETALSDPNSIVITETLATTMFGKENPIGKTIKLDNEYTVHVTAVIQDPPLQNSSINFEFLAPFEFKVQHFDWVKNAKTQWSNNFLMNVVELKEGVSMAALSIKIKGIMVAKDKVNNKDQSLFLHPMKKWRLYDEFKNWVNTGGRITYVRLFGIIGVFILLIACINFMNLSTARSEKRAKEVGIRKALGSKRSQLIVQFLSESMLTAGLAFVLSIGLMKLILPFLADLGFKYIKIDLSSVSLLLSIFGVCIITGLVSGSYPALFLSSFLPVKVLKGIFTQGRGPVVFRKVLVVSQFAISVGLIVSTVIVFQQINHAQERSIGYDTNNLITIPATNDLAKNYDVIKQDFLNTGYVENVSKASSPMTNVYNSWSGFSWQGSDPNTMHVFDVIMTEFDYEKTVGLNLLQGRGFSREYITDSSAVIINETALRRLGFKEPLGKMIKLDDQPLTIIGVVEDVVMKDPFKPVSPAVILFNKENVSNFFIRLKPQADLKKSLAAIKPIAERYNPSLPFEYTFVDEEFSKKFTAESQVAKLAGMFASLAILISCMGLFGLAMFMAERRIKEIGIRKVLGASVINLWALLSREFLLLVFIACLIASPLAYWLMNDWLQNYDYRITISWWIFVIAGLVAVVIALCTVSAQAIRAALSNPVKSLRNE